MQFDYQHKVGTDYSTVTLSNKPMKPPVLFKIAEKFQFLGGRVPKNMANWIFPSFITSEVISEVIHNTCFECGGLMKDGEAIVDHEYVYTDAGKELWRDCKFSKKIKVRKCTVCGHSHT